MSNVLVLFAHPVLEKSRAHARMIRNIKNMAGVTFRDLYELYPEFDIDVQAEQQLLLRHDIIIWQHPFYWYSAPPLLKQWIDLVLEHGWAYGREGNMLQGKRILNAISCGGPLEAYSKTGRNRFTIREFLVPFEQTAYLCNMQYLPPFVMPGTHRLSSEDIEQYSVQYENLVKAFVNNEIEADVVNRAELLNEVNYSFKSIQSL